MHQQRLNALAKTTLDCAFRVHDKLGAGLLESAYQACLLVELQRAGLSVLAEVPCPLVYDGIKITDVGYRMDLLVGGDLVVEVKAVEAIHPLHQAQLLSYLKLSDKRLGLLLNFNTVHLRDGIRRIAHNF